MDKKQLKHYIALVHFLGELLGDQFEVVLHIYDGKRMYIAEIVNGQLSGRTKDSPITKFALELMEEEDYRQRDYLVNYKTRTKAGKILQGSTFFIKDELDQLQGMICVNMDYSKQFDLADHIIKTLKLPISIKTAQLAEQEEGFAGNFTEILSENVNDIITEIIGPDQIQSNLSLTQEARLDIMRQLEAKGVFKIKGAVPQVARALGVSEPSVYRYRRMIQKKS
ncbi:MULTISPECIES: transcriptional regulator [Aerococcus]|nr:MULTISPECIES: PAS domain-containing protein [Aerococcus]MDK6369892.1 PAS domain-containing protein [Aerococcus sp. UMB9870]MDK6686850.1 PAS domain-containing protein [Aerococcus sp. UMB8623]MDK6939490.1 PAS domain-containing protein [Aerococcus sp. UMB8487]OFK18226.1 hypothetical protein HMPREF2829_07115 [Aerococcus sp. HMSC072A12]OFR35120.1 hypothetical protein HMPREF2892_01970 [Aerococcus sp. HMSC061A03]